jgi:UDP:flavonoid glycosyltransferase YjiC (YdhE family)
VLLGDGFCCPPDCSPFPDLRPWLPADTAVFRTEEIVLENVNRVLHLRGQPALDRLGQLYGEVDEVILTTLAEFDKYPNRALARYRGPWLPEGGELPAWPGGSGKKVFAYLKTSPALPQLLAVLRQAGCRTIIHADGVTAEFQRQHESPTLRFQADWFDLQRAAAECDLAVLNGAHGSTIFTHLAGKPILQLPLVLEQELNGRATVRLGAGACTTSTRGEVLATAFSGVLQSEAWAAAAGRFAARYARHCPREESRRAVDEVLGLLESPG